MITLRDCDRRALAIGGLDPSGGAGVTLDAVVMAGAGYAPLVAVTMLTAQNSASFLGMWPVAPEALLAQLEAVTTESMPACVKIGALGDAHLAGRLAEWLACAKVPAVVMDPVLASSSGGVLVEGAADAIATVARAVDVITPNAEEAGLLAGIDVRDEDSASEAGIALAKRFGCAVVVTGLQAPEPAVAVDILVNDGRVVRVPHPLVEGVGDVRGTGCMLASALSCALAEGLSMVDGLARAHRTVHRLVTAARPLGRGRLQVDLRRVIRGDG
jgi:hydroxymethylpyrimidine kinase/phosphomethylpyrimidine kinase